MHDYTIVSELILDSSSDAAIVRQSRLITRGEPLAYYLKKDISKVVLPSLDKRVTVEQIYHDMFYTSQLIRCKYLITERLDVTQALSLLRDLESSLSKNFKIKVLSYLTSPSKPDAIIIWM